MFTLNADKSKLTVLQRSLIPSGAVNVIDVEFKFSREWDGMERIAVFRVGSETVSVVLDDSNSCKLPWECVRENDIGKTVYAGVCGLIDSRVVLPTLWVGLGTIQEGTTIGDLGLPHTPSASEQILASLNEAKNAAEDAAERAEEAAKKAEDLVSSVDETVDKVDEAVAKIDESLSKVDEAVEKAEDAANKADEAIQKAEEAVEQVGGATANLESYVQRAETAAAKSEEEADRATEEANRAEAAVGNMEFPSDEEVVALLQDDPIIEG